MKRWWGALALIGLLLLLAVLLAPGGRRLTESLALLADIWKLGRPAGAEDPVDRPPLTIAYQGPGGEDRTADLYCSAATPPGARLVLIHGLVETGREDARLRALGRAFARHRFMVLVPDLPGMRALRAGLQDIDEVRAALDALHMWSACPSPTPRGEPAAPPGSPGVDLPTGVVGFSYSSGPVLLALDRDSPGADFAVLFGGYYDLWDVVLYLTTGRYRDAAQDHDGEALPGGRWVLLEANAAAIADGAEREALVAIARRRRLDAGAPIDDLLAGLGPDARAALDLLTNTDPDRFNALRAGVATRLRDVIDQLSPARALRRPLAIDLYLLHGRSDAIVPYTQTRTMADQLPVTGRLQVAILGSFQHARPAPGDGTWWSTALQAPGDSWRLLAMLGDLLERRRPAGPAPPHGGDPLAGTGLDRSGG